LGKGISALIPHEGIIKISVDEIEPNPFEPRKKGNVESLKKLSLSIKEKGILEPILVRRTDSGYQIICGSRRFEAAKNAGFMEVPAIVKDATDREVLELALVENIQRENLNPIEEAEAYKILLKEFNLSRQEIAKRVSRERTTITNSLRLLSLEEEIKDYIRNGKITAGHARALLQIKSKARRIKLARKIAGEKISVRESERIVKKSPFSYLEDELQELFGTKVKIIAGRKKGRIEIEFYGDEDLARIIKIMEEKSLKPPF